MTPERIEKIEVRVPESYLKMCNIQNPVTGLEAKFSLRVTTAMALAGENLGNAANYNEEICQDDTVVALRDKTKVTPESKWEHANSEVVVSTQDGLVLRQMKDVSVAEDDQERQWLRLSAKFRDMADPVIGADKAEAVVEAVGRLEQRDSLRDIAALCRG